LNDETTLRNQGMKISIFEGMFSIVFIVAIQGYFFTKTVLELGGDELILGVLTSIQFLGQSFQLFVPKIIEKIGSRKRFIIFGNGVGRGLWGLLVILPLLHLKVSTGILVATIGSSFILMNMASNAWTSWMRDLVPSETMGSYFGRRNLFITLISMASTYIFSMILNSKPNITRKLLLFGFYWNFIILFSSPYFSFHLLENIRIQFKYLGYFSLLSSSLSMFFYLMWGKLADRIGHKNIFRIGVSGAAFLATMWFFMTPSTVWKLLWIDSIMAAISWSAINISLFTIPILVSGKSTSVYISLFATFSGIGGFLGSLTGGAIAKMLSNVYLEIDGFDVRGIQFMFLTAGILRIISIFWINKVNVVGHVSLRNYLFVGFTNFSRRVRGNLFAQPPITRMVKYVKYRRQLSSKEKGIL